MCCFQNHPFWSVDRQEFVQAGSLEIGERLQTLSGDVKVVQQKLPRPGPQPVFNLEVHNEHVYFVGEDGVLVHNTGPYAEGGSLLPILDNSFVPDTANVVGNLTRRTVAEIADSPGIAKSLMSKGSYRHLVKKTGLAVASYRKAVERLVAKHVREDDMLSSVLRHTGLTRGAGGRFVSSPDFIGTELYNIVKIDITTHRALAKHMARPGVGGTKYVFHAGRPKNMIFPK